MNSTVLNTTLGRVILILVLTAIFAESRLLADNCSTCKDMQECHQTILNLVRNFVIFVKNFKMQMRDFELASNKEVESFVDEATTVLGSLIEAQKLNKMHFGKIEASVQLLKNEEKRRQKEIQQLADEFCS